MSYRGGLIPERVHGETRRERSRHFTLPTVTRNGWFLSFLSHSVLYPSLVVAPTECHPHGLYHFFTYDSGK